MRFFEIGEQSQWSVAVRLRKLAAIAWHHAKCDNCGKLFHHKDLELWQFAHIKPVNNAEDKNDRWGGKWRKELPLTPEWISFMGRVKLTCCQKCNHAVEGGDGTSPPSDITMDDFPTHLMKDVDLFE